LHAHVEQNEAIFDGNSVMTTSRSGPLLTSVN
jgi:hypothetical protein